MKTWLIESAAFNLTEFGRTYTWHWLRYHRELSRYQTARVMFAAWRYNVNTGRTASLV